MPLNRIEVVAGLFAEYGKLAEIVVPLTAAEWDAPTRCAGWCVRDVAAHVLGSAVDAAAGTVGSRTPDQQALAMRDRQPAELAADLRAVVERLRPAFARLTDAAWLRPGPVAGQSVGDAVLRLWCDIVVHVDDVHAALGRPPEPGPGLVAAVESVTTRLRRAGWGPARLALDGMDDIELGEGGPLLRGDPWRFVLVATGRADPATFGIDDRVNLYR